MRITPQPYPPKLSEVKINSKNLYNSKEEALIGGLNGLKDYHNFLTAKNKGYTDQLEEAVEYGDELTKIGLRDPILYTQHYTGYSCTLSECPYAEVHLEFTAVPKVHEKETPKNRLLLCFLCEVTSERLQLNDYPKPSIVSISTDYIVFFKEAVKLHTCRLNFGTGQIDNAIKIGINLTLLDYFTQLEALKIEEKDEPPDEKILIQIEEVIQPAMNRLIDELIGQQPEPCILQRSLQNEAKKFGALFKKLQRLKVKRWSELSS